MKKRLLFFYALLCAIPVSAYPDYVKNPRLEPLDNSSVFSFHEDARGAMWISTSTGLACFDGKGATWYSESLPMRYMAGEPGSDVFFYQDLEKIWRVNAKARSIEEVPPAGRLDVRHASLCTSSDTLFAADGKGLWRCCNIRGDSLKLVCKSEVPLRLIVSTAHHGLLAASSCGTVFQLKDGALVPFDDCSDVVKAVFEDSKGRLWAGLENNGIIRYSKHLKRESEIHPIKRSGEPARKIRTFCECSDGRILAGCLDGLFIIDSKDNCEIHHGSIPEGRAVCSLYKDSSSNIWIGAFYGGVFFCERDINPFVTVYGDNLELVNALVEDRRSDVWAATDGYGLFRIHPSGDAVRMGGVDSGKMKSAYYDLGRDAIWIGQYMSPLMMYDITKSKMHAFPFHDSAYSSDQGSIFGIHSILGELWLQTSGGIYLFDPSRDSSVDRKLPGFSGHAEAIFEAEDSRVWIGGSGLFVYESGTVREVSDLFGATCYDIIPHGDALLLGTSSGIMEMDPEGEVLRFWDRSNVGLTDNVVFRLQFIADGLLAAGTNSGVSILDLDNARCYNYTKNNGLGLSSAKEGAILRHSDGTVWVGGTDGVVRLSSTRISLPQHVPGLSVNRIMVNNSEIPAGSRNFVLSHRENNISFDVASYDFAGVMPSFYEARLFRAEKEWHPIDVRSPLSYMRLRPGKYSFQVRAKFTSGEDAPYAEDNVDFRIRYSMFWSPVAWFLYLLVAICLGRMQYVLVSEYMARHRSRKSNDILSIAKNRNDEDFLSKVVSSIEANISNGDYAVEDLCRDTGVSQTLLGNRLKSISGYSPRDFIEFLRLRKASSLLLEGKMNISAVAEAVGFNSSRYFATRFKKQFDKTPSEYISFYSSSDNQ